MPIIYDEAAPVLPGIYHVNYKEVEARILKLYGLGGDAMRMTELVRKRMKELGELLSATPAREDITETAEHMMLREAYLEVIALGAMLKAEIDRQESLKT